MSQASQSTSAFAHVLILLTRSTPMNQLWFLFLVIANVEETSSYPHERQFKARLALWHYQ